MRHQDEFFFSVKTVFLFAFYRVINPLMIQITIDAATQIAAKPTTTPSTMPPGSGPVQVLTHCAAVMSVWQLRVTA
jgi:hypothetical protein